MVDGGMFISKASYFSKFTTNKLYDNSFSLPGGGILEKAKVSLQNSNLFVNVKGMNVQIVTVKEGKPYLAYGEDYSEVGQIKMLQKDNDESNNKLYLDPTSDLEIQLRTVNINISDSRVTTKDVINDNKLVIAKVVDRRNKEFSIRYYYVYQKDLPNINGEVLFTKESDLKVYRFTDTVSITYASVKDDDNTVYEPIIKLGSSPSQSNGQLVDVKFNRAQGEFSDLFEISVDKVIPIDYLYSPKDQSMSNIISILFDVNQNPILNVIPSNYIIMNAQKYELPLNSNQGISGLTSEFNKTVQIIRFLYTNYISGKASVEKEYIYYKLTKPSIEQFNDSFEDNYINDINDVNVSIFGFNVNVKSEGLVFESTSIVDNGWTLNDGKSLLKYSDFHEKVYLEFKAVDDNGDDSVDDKTFGITFNSDGNPAFTRGTSTMKNLKYVSTIIPVPQERTLIDTLGKIGSVVFGLYSIGISAYLFTIL